MYDPLRELELAVQGIVVRINGRNTFESKITNFLIPWYNGRTRWRVGSETFKESDRCRILRTDSGLGWAIIEDSEHGLELRPYQEHNGYESGCNWTTRTGTSEPYSMSVNVVLGEPQYRVLVSRLKCEPRDPFSISLLATLPWNINDHNDQDVQTVDGSTDGAENDATNVYAAPAASRFSYCDWPSTIEENRRKLGDFGPTAAKRDAPKPGKTKSLEMISKRDENSKILNERTAASSKGRTGRKRKLDLRAEAGDAESDRLSPPLGKKRKMIPTQKFLQDGDGGNNAESSDDTGSESRSTGNRTRLTRTKRYNARSGLAAKGASVMNLYPDLEPEDIVRDHFDDLRGGTLLAICDTLKGSGVRGPLKQIVSLCNQFHPSKRVSEPLFRKVCSFALEAEDSDESDRESDPPRCKRCAKRRTACSIRSGNSSAPCNACTQAGCARDCTVLDYKPQSRMRQRRLGRV